MKKIKQSSRTENYSFRFGLKSVITSFSSDLVLINKFQLLNQMQILYCSKHSKDCKTVYFEGNSKCMQNTVEVFPAVVELLGGVFYRCLLGLVALQCCLSSVALLICCLVAVFIIENGVLESPTDIVELSISPLISVSFFFHLLKFSFQLLYFFNTRIFIWFYYIISLH